MQNTPLPDNPSERNHIGQEALHLYRLVPVADADDPRWVKDATIEIVLVAARSPGDARIVASEPQPDFPASDALPAEDVSTRFASAFRDEKLYTVVEVERDCKDIKRGLVARDPFGKPNTWRE